MKIITYTFIVVLTFFRYCAAEELENIGDLKFKITGSGSGEIEILEGLQIEKILERFGLPDETYAPDDKKNVHNDLYEKDYKKLHIYKHIDYTVCIFSSKEKVLKVVKLWSSY